jgi:hypothetical protein
VTGPIMARGEATLTIAYEGMSVVVRGLMPKARIDDETAGLIEMAPGLYLLLVKSLERRQDREAAIRESEQSS